MPIGSILHEVFTILVILHWHTFVHFLRILLVQRKRISMKLNLHLVHRLRCQASYSFFNTVMNWQWGAELPKYMRNAFLPGLWTVIPSSFPLSGPALLLLRCISMPFPGFELVVFPRRSSLLLLYQVLLDFRASIMPRNITLKLQPKSKEKQVTFQCHSVPVCDSSKEYVKQQEITHTSFLSLLSDMQTSTFKS